MEIEEDSLLDQEQEQEQLALLDDEDDFIIGEVVEPTEEEVEAAVIDNKPHIKELRKAFKDTAKRLKELEAENALLKQPITNTHIPVIEEEPTLEACGYDPDEYKVSLKQWFDKQAAEEKRKQDEEAFTRRTQEQFAILTNKYNEEKSKLKVKDYQDSEDEFCAIIHPQKQGDLLKYAKEPAKLIYALSKDPAKLKVLQDIDNQVDYVLKLKEYEDQMKAVKRTSAGVPPPESKLSSGTGSVVRNDAKLAQLELEADQTGDRTKLVAYRRSLKYNG